MTEVCEYTSAPWSRGILDVSGGTKSKAVSREKGSPSQDELRSGGMKIADLFLMMNERFDEQKRFKEEMDSQKDIKNSNHRLEQLQLRVPRAHLADMGIQEWKSGELKEIATEVSGKRPTRLNRSDNSRCYRHSQRSCYHNRR